MNTFIFLQPVKRLTVRFSASQPGERGWLRVVWWRRRALHLVACVQPPPHPPWKEIREGRGGCTQATQWSALLCHQTTLSQPLSPSWLAPKLTDVPLWFLLRGGVAVHRLFTWGILSLWLPDFFCPHREHVCRLHNISVNASSEHFCGAVPLAWLARTKTHRRPSLISCEARDGCTQAIWGILSLWLPDFFCPRWEPVCRLRNISVNASSEHFCGTSGKKTTWLKKLVIIIQLHFLRHFFYLSELAGLLVTGLKTYSSSKTRYIR